jgi:transposase
MTLKDLHDEKRREVSLLALSGYTLIEAQRLSREICVFEAAIADINASIHQEQAGNDQANLLLSIPGVGPVTAMTFMAYVGDGNRFANGRQVSNYAGMTSRVDSSGETTKLGGISKRGCSAIRAVVVQAAWAAVLMKGPNPLKEKFQDLAARRGKGRAIVAIARRILELMWVVSVRKERYRSTTPEAWRMKLLRLRMLNVIKAESAA